MRRAYIIRSSYFQQKQKLKTVTHYNGRWGPRVRQMAEQTRIFAYDFAAHSGRNGWVLGKNFFMIRVPHHFLGKAGKSLQHGASRPPGAPGGGGKAFFGVLFAVKHQILSSPK
ncbi:hypothetical protein TNIN_233021 [Trichonephila inaurata madagascariensis]|uniref:Uncharacterized protein n=1 Tax=Trichonephila inaurata madagascariensis TaxID=2747483 RepID=A0A8X6XVW1_9ARAC|nr:hypothetical protein TNIN_233021 [Trichonephila inaurata madagascariensis]